MGKGVNFTRDWLEQNNMVQNPDGSYSRRKGLDKLISTIPSIAKINNNIKQITIPSAKGPNKWERSYGQLLEYRKGQGEIAYYLFESINLRLADRTWYKPDYFVITTQGQIQIHEVKGFWHDDARVKIKVAAELYPAFEFIAITKAKNNFNGEWEYEYFRSRQNY